MFPRTGRRSWSATEIDEGKLEAFMGQAVTDMGAMISAPLMVIGEKLGLYKAMAGAGPLTSAEVAERSVPPSARCASGSANQAAGGYVTYDPESDRYTLPDEHALALADEDSPFYILGAFELIASLYADEDKILEAFRSGEGMGWHEHDHRLFRGTERFFRPGYRAHLVDEWIPALEGVQEKLERGARVADVGCGHGASTVIMAEAFPNSRVPSASTTTPSRSSGRARPPREAGVADRIELRGRRRQGLPGTGYDLVCVFDCLHDMGDPVGASAHVLETLDAGRHLDDRRAVRGRPRRGQPQPGRPRLLRRLDDDLHAGLAGPGGRPRARRSGRRGAPARGRHRGRLQQRAPRHRDAVQPGPRSEAVQRLLEHHDQDYPP